MDTSFSKRIIELITFQQRLKRTPIEFIKKNVNFQNEWEKPKTSTKFFVIKITNRR